MTAAPTRMDTPSRSEHDETWFGSGLRAHLGIRLPANADSETAADAEEAVAEAEPETEVAPAPPADDDAVAADSLLAELAERERRLREAESELAERERTLAAAEEELAARLREAARNEPALPVRNTLRDRAEREAERLWRTIDDALEASFEDGRPDFHARLAAIKLLLGEAYDGQSAADALPARDAQHEDELAARRAERFQL